MGARRINARIDLDLQAKLDLLRAAAGSSTTDVLREAIERYHASMEAETGQRARDAFAASGFVGCAEGPPDLADRAKPYLVQGLATKLTRERSGHSTVAPRKKRRK